MALSNLFSLISQKMDYLTQRQGVIAQNIAQANTPEYKPKDLISFDEVLKKTQHAGSNSFQLAATNPKHLVGNTAGGTIRSKKESDLYEVKPSGNAVNLEQQLSNMSDTTAQYQMMTSLYKKSLSLLKTALGRGGA